MPTEAETEPDQRGMEPPTESAAITHSEDQPALPAQGDIQVEPVSAVVEEVAPEPEAAPLPPATKPSARPKSRSKAAQSASLPQADGEAAATTVQPVETDAPASDGLTVQAEPVTEPVPEPVPVVGKASKSKRSSTARKKAAPPAPQDESLWS